MSNYRRTLFTEEYNYSTEGLQEECKHSLTFKRSKEKIKICTVVFNESVKLYFMLADKPLLER